MKMVMTGATGLIGSALRRELTRLGHEVLVAGRVCPPADPSLVMDFSAPPDRDWWRARLPGVEVVINAAGIFEETHPGDFENVHARGPTALFEGAALAGVGVVIQISALGADASATTPFQRSKHQADRALAALAIASATVLPSLVFSPDGQSSRLFLLLARSPVLVLPRSQACIQPIDLDDLIECIVRLATGPAQGKRVVHGVGPRPLTLRSYLQTLRTSLGLQRRAWVVEVPARRVVALARFLGKWGLSLVSGDALQMLLRGNTASADPIAAVLGRAPHDPATFVTPELARSWRSDLGVAWAYYLVRAAFAAVWLITALVSLGLYPLEDSLSLLRQFGLQGSPAWIALYAGALADLALGLALVVAPRAHMQKLWVCQFVLISVYTVLISATMPGWWLHPFGPLTKNLPMLAGIVLMMQLQRRM